MTFRDLFKGVELGDVVSCTRGADTDREAYICGVINELEGMGYVVEYMERGLEIDFHLERRRKQNA